MELVEGGQGFCDYNTKALVMKFVTIGDGGLKFFQNYVM